MCIIEYIGDIFNVSSDLNEYDIQYYKSTDSTPKRYSCFRKNYYLLQSTIGSGNINVINICSENNLQNYEYEYIYQSHTNDNSLPWNSSRIEYPIHDLYDLDNPLNDITIIYEFGKKQNEKFVKINMVK